MYVVTDEDIRQSGATDLPTVLRRIPGLEVMQMTEPISMSARGETINRSRTDADHGRRTFDLSRLQETSFEIRPGHAPEMDQKILKGPTSAI